MKKIMVENLEFELTENIREGFNEEEFKSKYTDFFECYDYIVGDWAYGKLRLKGFYEESNKKVKEFNNIKTLNKYIENNCAYKCRYFILKRVYKK